MTKLRVNYFSISNNAIFLKTIQPGYEAECNGFRPVIDGDIIPDYYYNLRQRGEYMHVREMIGMNQNDGFNILCKYHNNISF